LTNGYSFWHSGKCSIQQLVSEPRSRVQWEIVAGCTIVLWRKPSQPSHNQRVLFLVGQLLRRDCFRLHQLSRGEGQVGQVKIESCQKKGPRIQEDPTSIDLRLKLLSTQTNTSVW